MPAHYRVALFSFITTLVLLVSLAAPIMASADDGAPPPESTPESVETSEEAPSTETAAEDVSIPEILDQAPEGTELVVLDQAGEALPLASDAAAEALATGDPIWCPAGVTPANDADDLDQDCTNSFATFGDESTAGTLIYELHNNPGSYSGAGTIYVETIYAGEAGNNVNIDTSSIGGGSLSDLVLQGGWNGMFGGAATFGGTTNFGTTSLSIYNWNGSVSVYNLILNGSQNGLQIESYGDVVLDNVTSNNTTDNHGIDIETQGDLTADNVTANGNEYDGMSAGAIGEVSITNSEFDNNGVNAHYYEDPGVWTVLTGASGLTVFANGDISLAQTNATGNGFHGANLYNYYGGEVSVTDGTFSNNGYTGDLSDNLSVSGEYTYYTSYVDSGSGLSIGTSTGDITIAGVTANDNADHGGYFTSATGDIHVSESEFNGNGAFGSAYAYVNDADYGQSMYLEYQAGNGVFSYTDGSVTLAGIAAISNANHGAEAFLDGDLEVTDSLFADNGWSNGIFACEQDALCGYDLLYELMFSDAVNGYSAVPGLCEADNAPSFEFFIFNPCSEDLAFIDVSGPNFSFGAGAFGGESYYIESWDLSLIGGAGLLAGADEIVLDEVGAYENSETGAELYQTNQGAAAITITDSEFSANGGGPSESGFMGGSLYVGETIYISGEAPDLEYSGGFEFTYGDGLSVNANAGNVTLTGVEAYSNAAHGAEIYTAGTLLVQGNDEISFSDNGNIPILFAGEGLFGDFLDEVGIFGFTICCTLEIPASGMYLEFYLGSELYSEPDYFEVYGDLFSGSGLDAEAETGVTLNDVYAYANGGYGADVWTAGNANIMTGEFSGNGEGIQAWFDLCFGEEDCNYIEFFLSPSSGLSVDAGGEVTVTGIQANGNVLYGAELYSDASDSVIVNESGFFANGYGTGGYMCDAEDPEYCDETEEYWGGSGVYVDTSGNIYMNDVTASGNSTDGAELLSGGDAAICNSEFQGNGDYGVDAWGVYGSLTLSDVVFGGNSSGDYDYDGTALETTGFNCNPPHGGGGGPAVPGLPWNIVPIDGGEQVGLNCELYAGTLLQLDNGDHAILPCPIQDIGVLKPTTADALPGEVGGEFEFASGFDLEVLREGEAVDIIQDGIATVAFTIPEGVSADDLAILWWNGSEWVPLHEVEGDGRVVSRAGFVTEDGYFAASVNFTGTFILVQE